MRVLAAHPAMNNMQIISLVFLMSYDLSLTVTAIQGWLNSNPPSDALWGVGGSLLELDLWWISRLQLPLFMPASRALDSPNLSSFSFLMVIRLSLTFGD